MEASCIIMHYITAEIRLEKNQFTIDLRLFKLVFDLSEIDIPK
jgi:hypothetical protein